MKEHYRTSDLNTTEGPKRFRFKSFTERISSINVDVYHRIGRTQLEPSSEADSFFHQSLDEWKELDLSGHMSNFVKEVSPLIHSLPQILFHKDKLVEILLNHLKVKDSTSLKPLLNLSCLLARDLQDQFYPYCHKFFATFATLLDLSDPDLIEDIFQTMSYFLKFLQKILVDHIMEVYEDYILLLGHSKHHIRKFAAQSFAFLVRKLDRKPMKKFLETILAGDKLPTNDMIDGTGILLFELVKVRKNLLKFR